MTVIGFDYENGSCVIDYGCYGFRIMTFALWCVLNRSSSAMTDISLWSGIALGYVSLRHVRLELAVTVGARHAVVGNRQCGRRLQRRDVSARPLRGG